MVDLRVARTTRMMMIRLFVRTIRHLPKQMNAILLKMLPFLYILDTTLQLRGLLASSQINRVRQAASCTVLCMSSSFYMVIYCFRR